MLTASSHTLAVAGIFTSGRGLMLATIGFLALLAIVIGTASAIRTHTREGSGSAITAQIGTIIFAVLILLSVGIAAAFTREANSHGISNPVDVQSPWGQ
jgi:hypothetical protein